MSAALAIQKLIYDQLSVDPGLLSILGAPHIYDGAPDHAKTPYVLFGKIESSDWSTDNEPGEEHLVELLVWSSQKGRKETVQIIEAIKTALENLSSSTPDCHLVNFSWEATTTGRSEDNMHFTGIASFRAVTERSSL